MKRLISISHGLAVSAILSLAACNKPQDPADAHAGHDHASEGGSHEGEHGETGVCPEHNLPADQCGICKPEAIPGLKPGESLQLRLASGESAEMAGVDTVKSRQGGPADGVDCYAEFGFAQNKVARIAAPVSGVVQEVLVDPGGKVAEKQTVARIWSAGIAEAVAKAVLTHQTLDRERKLRDQRVTPEKDLQEAEAQHRAACQSLRTLGFSEEQIDGFRDKPQDSVLLDARAPFAGEITGSTVVRGAMVEVGTPLFTMADRSVMWADLAVPETALERLREGQQVELTVDSLPGRKFTGKLTWINAELDERTRMVRARAEVPNPDGMIKARMFAKARILTSGNEGAVLVPARAIQRIDGKPFLFIKQGQDLFDARAVRLGPVSGDSCVIAGGLQAGEEVAVAHAFALKSQLLISRLGAGCADD